jgi:hypothetical protein
LSLEREIKGRQKLFFKTFKQHILRKEINSKSTKKKNKRRIKGYYGKI